MNLHRRRSGLRSNRKKLVNTVQEEDTRRLKSIPEESRRDVSSSEKPPKVHALLVNDTILEERESLGGCEEPMEGLSED
jgi:vacuolar-type H+-ATPase subunit I/STV1